MSLTKEETCRRFYEWVRVAFPAPYPVTVKWRPHIPHDKEDIPRLSKREVRAGIYGDCYREGRRFIIRLSKRRNLTINYAVDTLLHEWAHTLTWGLENQNRCRESFHDDEFWLALGRIYRAYHEHPTEPGWRKVKGR
jgi:hypothetical protein